MRWPCKRKWEIEELEWGENVKCGWEMTKGSPDLLMLLGGILPGL